MDHADSPNWIDLNAALSAAPLPALPQSAIRVLEISRDPENGPAELSLPIESDSALASQVLRFVNSSYFGFRHEIGSIKQGIALVGLRTIKNFVLWTAVFSAVPDPKCGDFCLQSFRSDALRRGLFAKSLAKLLGVEKVDEVFTAALLQDIAVPLLTKRLGETYTKLLTQRDDGRVRLSQLEDAAFGWTHAAAASILFKRWSLPSKFARLVQGHTQPELLVSQGPAVAGELAVALSSLLPAECDHVWCECPCLASYWEQLEINSLPPLPDFLARVDQAFEEVSVGLSVKTAKEPLVARFAEAGVSACGADG